MEVVKSTKSRYLVQKVYKKFCEYFYPSRPDYSYQLLSRGTTLSVASRARELIIGFRYGLEAYFDRYASSMLSLMEPLTGSKLTSLVMPAALIRPAFCFSAD